MKRGRVLLGVLLCYALAYAVLIAMAARKGLDITDPFSLAVWLLSALALLLVCAIVPLSVWTITRLCGVRFRRVFSLWGVTIFVFGLALIYNVK